MEEFLKNNILRLVIITTAFSSQTLFAYSCALIGIPHVVYQAKNVYPNSGLLINNWIIYNQLQHDAATLSEQDLKQIKPLFSLLDSQQNAMPYRYQKLLPEYSWAQPNQNLENNQEYTLDLSPLLSYAHQFDNMETQVKFPFKVEAQNFKIPKQLSNTPLFEFKSSQFADEEQFGNGGFHTMKIDVNSDYNLDDYLLLLNMKNYSQKTQTQFIIDDITRHTAHHVSLEFTNDICGKNLDFYQNEKWSIQLDLISPDGQIIKQANEAYVFNTSKGGNLSFWDKLKNWWRTFKLNWL